MLETHLNTHIINSPYVLFVGAGASAPLGLNPTGPFMNMLPEKLKELIQVNERKDIGNQTERFKELFDKAGQYYGVSSTDSEVFLDYLDHLISTCESLSSLPALFHDLSGTSGAGGYQGQWSEMFSRIRNYVQTTIVEHYSRVDGVKAHTLYDPLLEALGRLTNKLPVFTTNYDWVFESLAEADEDNIYLEDGFKNAPLGERWDRGQFDEFTPLGGDRMDLFLFKLHGSTSWYRDSEPPNFIRKFPNPSPEFAGSRAVLIYPTQVKLQATTVDPFKTAYDYLEQTLILAKLCVFIGFSFRDPAINQAIQRAIDSNQELKLVVVEPSIEDPAGPILAGFVQRLGFTSEGWRQRMRFIRAHFGTSSLVQTEIQNTIDGLEKWDSLDALVSE